MDYKSSGVDTELGDRFVEKIKRMVGKTYDARTMSGVGGFAALYKMDEDRYLASSTDGVGTKLKLATETGIHHTIGIDLVAMCVNDLLCTGASPMFFLDYFASGKLDLAVSEKVMEGIVEGCLQGKLALIGGETAEMPGMYQDGDYDLAGFSVGEVTKKDLLDGSRVQEGDVLIAIPSSGFHSNGFSLIRKIIATENDAAKQLQLKKDCLVPTRIYVKNIIELRKKLGSSIKGLAHITGSGLLNIPRINEAFDYEVNQLPSVPSFMAEIMKRSGLSEAQLAVTFNMGMGMVVAVSADKKTDALNALSELGEKAIEIGSVVKGSGQVQLNGQLLT